MKRTVGYGWCGQWASPEGQLGFLMSRHIASGKRNAEPLSAEQRESLSGKSKNFATSDFYKVKVTIEIVKNKRGKPIVRRADDSTKETR